MGSDILHIGNQILKEKICEKIVNFHRVMKNLRWIIVNPQLFKPTEIFILRIIKFYLTH